MQLLYNLYYYNTLKACLFGGTPVVLSFKKRSFFFKKHNLVIDVKHNETDVHSLTISSLGFKPNLRYFGYSLVDGRPIVYYPGRSLVLVKEGKTKELRRTPSKLPEMLIKTIFAGVNFYKTVESPCAIHFLSFNPLVLCYYKFIVKYIKVFFSLNERSIKFSFIRFKQPKRIFRKFGSIKKNLLKQDIKKLKKNDYKLITF